MIHISDVNVYGGASTYAFVQMVRPSFGARIKVRDGEWYVDSGIRSTLPNKDPNGGSATTFSIYLGRILYASHHFKFSAFAGYQRLWYGGLYNNGLGGGFSGTLYYGKFYANAKIAALYGLSGTIGYHLKHPGNDYSIIGSLGVQVNKNLDAYIYLTQQRYVNAGPYGSNALTYTGAGLGLKYKF